MRRRTMLVLGLATAVLAGSARPATAQPPPPDERVAAREFSYAAYRLRVAVKGTVPEIDRRLGALDCLDDLDVPDRIEDEAGALFAGAFIDALIGQPLVAPVR